MRSFSPRTISSSRTTRVVATTTLIGAFFLSPTFATPASAASAPCGTIANAYYVRVGVCELPIYSDTTWTPPAGVTNLQAIAVGGGGAGYVNATDPANFSAFGGGGSAPFFTELDETQPLVIHIGLGGIVGGADGGITTIDQGTTQYAVSGGETAPSATSPNGGGRSGEGFDGTNHLVASGSETGNFGGGGGGDGSPSQTLGEEAEAGPGVAVKDFFGATGSLFSDVTTCVTGGGGVAVTGNSWIAAYWSTSNCGGGAVAIDFNSSTYTVTPVTPNTGAGGGAYFIDFGNTDPVSGAEDGADGLVLLRFNYSTPILPVTGSSSILSWIFGAAIALLTAGGLALTRRR